MTVAVSSEAAPPVTATEETATPSGSWDVARIRRVGFIVLGVQLVCLMLWSALLARRFALSLDFAIYHQAWWAIGHGDVNPYSSVLGYPFWQGHGEFLLWPLAMVGDLWPHTVTMLWVQDVAVVGAEAVALVWLCEILDERRTHLPGPRWAPALVSIGVVLLVADPWIYWSASFDFHSEPLGVCFLLLAAHELWRRPRGRRLWLWAILTLACGDVMTTYLLAVGVTGLVAGRRWRSRGIQVALVSTLWALILSALGANKAAQLQGAYGYLVAGTGVPSSVGLTQVVKGIVVHPATVVRVLWSKLLDLYATVAAAGLVGVLWPWAAVSVVLVLLENGLNTTGVLFISPSFQSIVVYILVPIGTVAVLARLASRHNRAAKALTVLVVCSTLGWGATWIPQLASHWLRVSPGASTTLESIDRRIPAGDEVIASQGIAGGFSSRKWIYAVQGPGAIAVHTSPVWAVIAPNEGIERAVVSTQAGWIAEMAGPLHATLVVHRAGIWAFRWTPAAGTTTLVVPSVVRAVPAWTSPGSAGTVSAVGPSTRWRAQGGMTAGYVVAADYWQAVVGRYVATVTLSSTVSVDVEVWNATADTLLARRQVPPTGGTVPIVVPVTVAQVVPEHVYAGAGPFQILPVPPPAGNQVELRVWSAGGGLVRVASLALLPISR